METTERDPIRPAQADSFSEAGRKGSALKHIRISVVIVSYNVKDFLQPALVSLQRALQPFENEIFVVDNASTDGSVEIVKSHFPDVQLIANRENLGFARANNLALQRASGDYLVLINPDTIAQEDTFTRLIAFMEATPDAGMASCKILNPDGTLQLACRRSFPTPWVAFSRLTGLSFLFPGTRLFGRYNLTYLPEEQTAEVDAISGSFMLLRREAFSQVGLLDESFFLYGEDLDWCLRFSEAGWKIYYVPVTQIIHFKGESSKHKRLDTLLDFNRAMALFVKKHFRRRYFFITYYLLLLAIWLRAGAGFFRNTAVRLAPLFLDVLVLQLSLAAALYVRFGHLRHWKTYLPVNAVYALVWIAALYLAGSYGKWRFSFFRACAAAFAGFVVNSALTFFFKQYAFSRAVLLWAALFNHILLGGWRLGFKLLHLVGLAPFRGTLGHTLLSRRALLVGDFSAGEEVLDKLKMQFGDGYNIVGLVSINPEDVGARFNGWEVIGQIGRMREIIAAKNIQDVIFSTHRIPYDRILSIISQGRSSHVNFKLIPSNIDVIIGKASIDRFTEIPLVEIDYRLAQKWPRFLKRGFDALAAGIGLLLGLPFFAGAWIIRRGATAVQEVRLQGAPSGHMKITELPAAGRIGKLFWLWPVLRGQLTLVGRELHTFDADPAMSQYLKPGLTGLVQINRNRNLTREEKEKYQLFYLIHYSILLDLEILLKTLFKL